MLPCRSPNGCSVGASSLSHKELVEGARPSAPISMAFYRPPFNAPEPRLNYLRPTLSPRVGSPNGKPHLMMTRRTFIDADMRVASFLGWVEAGDVHFIPATTYGQLSAAGHQ